MSTPCVIAAIDRGIQNSMSAAGSPLSLSVTFTDVAQIKIHVIELKKTTSQETDDFDRRRLKAFRDQLGYKCAVFVKAPADGAQLARKSIGYNKRFHWTASRTRRHQGSGLFGFKETPWRMTVSAPVTLGFLLHRFSFQREFMGGHAIHVSVTMLRTA